ncbi:MAG: prepilin-type N-terminal cleavage/methylation domain-containing protein [Elusimicrobia bacterium]|nr:prepilin-type N-terminal cleavage/methylation domain-containing protein [Elusimicrobiota bacterium]
MRRPRRRSHDGFTLLELVIATSLSTIVLVGIFSMGASMVQYEAEGMRKGSINGWSLASLVTMNRELEDASALVYPTTGSQDSLVFCSNWSRLAGAQINTAAGNYAVVYYYCWDAASNVLRRMTSPLTANTPCPSSSGYSPPACNSGTYGTGSTVATGVYRDSNNDSIFSVDPLVTSTGTVRMRYVVGNPNPGASPNEGNGLTIFSNPQTMAFDTRITLDKAFGAGNGSD